MECSEAAMQIDLARQIGAVTREVQGGEREGKPVRVVSASRSYDTTPDDLWEALTSAERIPRWFLPISGDLKLGGHYQFEGNAGGEIRRCDPPNGGSAGYTVTWGNGAGEPAIVQVRLTAVDATSTRFE